MRGASSVVAVLMMFAIAVIVGIALMLWVVPFESKPTIGGPEGIRELFVEKCNSTSNNITLRNLGSVSLTSPTTISIYNLTAGTDTGCIITFSADFKTGNTSSFIASGCQLHNGSSYFMRKQYYPDTSFVCSSQ